MKKRNLVLGVITTFIVLVGLFMVFGFTEPDADAVRATITGNTVSTNSVDETSELVESDENFEDIDFEQSSFEFEGFGPGKSHVGTFDIIEGKMFFEDDRIVKVQGSIDASSVSTGIDRLDTHLQSDDFFDVEKYPEISFVSTSIDHDSDTMTGDLDFRGVTKEISFPVELTENSVKADFILDTEPFEMKYLAVDKEVRIAFEFVA
jgi:polyisoprenoid-binding protein YceI